MKKIIHFFIFVMACVPSFAMQQQSSVSAMSSGSTSSVSSASFSSGMRSDVASDISYAELNLQQLIEDSLRNSAADPHDDTLLKIIVNCRDVNFLRSFYENNFADFYKLVLALINARDIETLKACIALMHEAKIPFDVSVHPDNQQSLLLHTLKQMDDEKSLDHVEPALLQILELILQEGACIARFVRDYKDEAVAFLIKHGARFDVPANECVVLDAVSANKISMTRLLVEHGAKTDCLMNSDVFVTYFDALSTDMVKFLIELGVPCCKKGSVAAKLIAAVNRNNVESVVACIHAEPCGNYFNNDGECLLEVAVRHKNANMVKALLINAHASVTRLLVNNKYEVIDFILQHLGNYFPMQLLKNMLQYVQQYKASRTEDVLQAYIARRADDEKEDVTSPEPIAEPVIYTEHEQQFWKAVETGNNKEAYRLFKVDPLIRITLNGPIPNTNIIKYALENDNDELVRFLIRHRFNEIYPFIQALVHENDCAELHKLIKLGLNVDLHPMITKRQEDVYALPHPMSYQPCNTRSLLKIALYEYAVSLATDKTKEAIIQLLLLHGASLDALLLDHGFKMNLGQLRDLQSLLVHDQRFVPLKQFLERELKNAAKASDMWEVGVQMYEDLTTQHGKKTDRVFAQENKLPHATRQKQKRALVLHKTDQLKTVYDMVRQKVCLPVLKKYSTSVLLFSFVPYIEKVHKAVKRFVEAHKASGKPCENIAYVVKGLRAVIVDKALLSLFDETVRSFIAQDLEDYLWQLFSDQVFIDQLIVDGLLKGDIEVHEPEIPTIIQLPMPPPPWSEVQKPIPVERLHEMVAQGILPPDFFDRYGSPSQSCSCMTSASTSSASTGIQKAAQ